MNRHRSLLLAGVAAALFGGLVPSAQGSCVGPEVDIVKPATKRDRPARLVVGESVSAQGSYWLAGCNDNPDTTGCSPPEAPVNPMTDIEVRITGPVTEKLEREYRREGVVGRARFTRVVGEKDADDKGSFLLSFTVPKLPAGRYFLLGSDESPTLVRIVAGPRQRHPERM